MTESNNLQNRMIIRKSRYVGFVTWVRDAFFAASTWSAWLFVIWYFFKHSNDLDSRNFVFDWQMLDIFLGLSALSGTQIGSILVWHLYRNIYLGHIRKRKELGRYINSGVDD